MVISVMEKKKAGKGDWECSVGVGKVSCSGQSRPVWRSGHWRQTPRR